MCATGRATTVVTASNDRAAARITVAHRHDARTCHLPGHCAMHVQPPPPAHAAPSHATSSTREALVTTGYTHPRHKYLPIAANHPTADQVLTRYLSCCSWRTCRCRLAPSPNPSTGPRAAGLASPGRPCASRLPTIGATAHPARSGVATISHCWRCQPPATELRVEDVGLVEHADGEDAVPCGECAAPAPLLPAVAVGSGATDADG